MLTVRHTCPHPSAALAVAALAVVCLGALTVTHQRTELLVGSYNVGRGMPGKAAPQSPRGFGETRSNTSPCGA